MSERWVHERLPVRRVQARPEVTARLRDGGRVREAPMEPGFVWNRSTPASAGPGEASSPAVPDEAVQPTERPIAGSANDDAPGGPLDDRQRQGFSFAEESAPGHAAPSPGIGWWEGIPAVRQLLADGLDLGEATVFVGENGSGKSTLVEGLAMAYGLAPEGGSTGSRHRTHASEAGLGEQLAVIRNAGASKFGYFLRAETMHAFFTYLEENPGNDLHEPLFHQLSHGESFVALVEVKMKPKWPGLLVLDEPESALSFENQLVLLRHLQGLMSTGRHQIVMATHSPILAALPGATLYEVDERGFHEADHDDATLVRKWRHFMNDPSAFLD